METKFLRSPKKGLLVYGRFSNRASFSVLTLPGRLITFYRRQG